MPQQQPPSSRAADTTPSNSDRNPTDATYDSGGLVLPRTAQDLLFREARTANTFTDEPVTDDQLAAIWDLARWGPTGANTQPLRLVAVRSPEAKAGLVALMAEGNRAKTAAAPLTLVLGTDLSFYEQWDRLMPFKPGVGGAIAQDPAGAERTARLNGALQIGYLLIGVRAAGLGAGPMVGFDIDGVEARFFPDGRTKALVVLNVGHPGPDAWSERLPRLEPNEVLSTV